MCAQYKVATLLYHVFLLFSSPKILSHTIMDALYEPRPTHASDWDPAFKSQVLEDAFAHPSLPPQPFVATDVLNLPIFPNQSLGNWHADAFAHPSLPPQPFAATDVLNLSIFPNRSQAPEEVFAHPSLPPQPFAATDVLDLSSFPNQSQALEDVSACPFLSSHPFTATDVLSFSLLSNQSQVPEDVFALPSLSPQPFVAQAATAASSLEWTDETKQAVWIRADDKGDQGGKCHAWADLQEQAPETHDVLRWAWACAELHVIKDVFPSRRSQDVDILLDAGIRLYVLEHGESIGELVLVFIFPYSFLQFCYSELAISRPDSRRTILNSTNHSQTNDKDVLETQIVLRLMGFLKNQRAMKLTKDQQAMTVEANLLNRLCRFGINFDFIDLTSVRTIYYLCIAIINENTDHSSVQPSRTIDYQAHLQEELYFCAPPSDSRIHPHLHL
jgi:hypothetical protein